MDRDFVGYGEAGPSGYWPDGKRLALSIVVNYEEGAEQNLVDGAEQETLTEWGSYAYPADVRNLAMESMFEYGSRVGVWRILNALASRGVKATIFASAVALERNRQVARAIDRDGHEVCSHGYRWEEVFKLSEEEESQHIEAAIASIEETMGRRPQGWYCRYGASVATRRLLVREGNFAYDSDAYNDDTPYFVQVEGKRHLVVPYAPDANDFGFWQSNGPSTSTQFYEYLKDTFDVLYEEGATMPRMMSVGLHCRIIGRPGRISALTNFLDYARGHDGVWFATRNEIADAWRTMQDSDEVVAMTQPSPDAQEVTAPT